MKHYVTPVLLAISFSFPAYANDEPDKQCQQISSLTGDYFAQRLEGKSMGEMQQATPPEFMHTNFFKMIDLAINLAFTFPESQTEEQVEQAVYDNCLQHKQH